MGSRARFALTLAWVVSLGLVSRPGGLGSGGGDCACERRRRDHLPRRDDGRAERAPDRIGAGAAPTRGVRRIPHGSSTAAPLVTASPRANGSALAAAPPSLLANFNGVSSRDSAVTNFGPEFEPPDQGLCVGNGFVVEMVNSAYTVYRPDGSVVTGRSTSTGLRRGPDRVHQRSSLPCTTRPPIPGSRRSCSSTARAPSVPRRSRRQHLRRSHHAVDRLPDRHDRHRREDRTQASRLPVPRRPAHARDRPVQRLHHAPTSSRSSARSSTAPRSTRSPRASWSRPVPRPRRRTSCISTS